MNESMLPDEPKEKVVMEIILTNEGEILVRGMIQDKTIALGLLEQAKMKLQEYWASLEIKLVKPKGDIMNFIRNGKKH